ncbi:electron transport complex subunit RsxC [Shewanella donghaensis]|uniref:electron transport complex subunit RsxC n=1 Tax=Shewanella donghaensis TaxID=238836 RepID=UPI0011836913|nr:electron transport complex subunit RsxC [Shewanella donghaensis]
MLTLLEQIDKGTLWHSPGGIHPPQLKQLSNTQAISTIALADKYLVPLPQVGDCARLAVNVGDQVLKGQLLTEGEGFMYLPVHAPTSGEITSVEQHPSNHASGLPCLTCTIKADGHDSATDYTSTTLSELSNQQILDKIKQAGIAGMGGATFPSHIKLNPASEIDLVIINGVECEPYITSDDVLMREYATDIIKGIEVINTLLNPQRIIIAIEDNKPEAATAMQVALAKFTALVETIRITVIPTKYPSGGEKQLIQIVTGKEVHTGSIPAQQGIVVHNVGTAYAIQDAVLNGKPLVERLVTITGEQVSKPGNYWLPIGTPVKHALEQTKTQFDGAKNQASKVIIGGPMMGYALPRNDVPVLKGTNCILVPSSHEIAPDVDEKACIRCGECAVVCPALLLPQQLFWHAKAEEYDKAASFNLKDCIECGCCSYVCPSDIPLVEYYRIAKSALKNEAEEKFQAEQAKIRFETRLKRLDDEKLAREEKSRLAAEKRKASMTTTSKDAVAEAMARVAAKKKAAQSDSISEHASKNVSDKASENTSAVASDKSAAVKAAIARAKAKKLAAKSDPEELAQVDESINDKKAQIAAAVARAKAKKLAAKLSSETKSSETSSSEVDVQVPIDAPVDDKKAKIAAAVARAKAKKLAASQTAEAPTLNQSLDTDIIEQTEIAEAAHVPVNDKKAKIATAVAKAKAKKLAASQTSGVPAMNQNVDSIITEQAESAEHAQQPADDKKAKIAAAVAKAKAKKLAASQTAEAPALNQHLDTDIIEQTKISEPTHVPVDDKKARIAAAVAKAKAKKLANQRKLSEEE